MKIDKHGSRIWEIGDTVWFVEASRSGRVRAIEALISGYEIMAPSESGRPVPEHEKRSYTYRGPLHDWFPTYYEVCDAKTKHVCIFPCTRNLHFSDICATELDAVVGAIDFAASQFQDEIPKNEKRRFSKRYYHRRRHLRRSIKVYAAWMQLWASRYVSKLESYSMRKANDSEV
jgi:hypothetical protein